jgi:hypothetical protein
VTVASTQPASTAECVNSYKLLASPLAWFCYFKCSSPTATPPHLFACLLTFPLLLLLLLLQFLTGYYAAPGWPKPSTPVKYKRVGGVVRLTAQDMPFQSSVWSTVANGIYNATNSAFLGADAFETWADAVEYKISMGFMYPRGLLYSASAHLCSYMCALSAYVADSKGEWCLLHAAGAADLAAATYCSNFPPYAIAAVFPTTPAFP